MIGFKEHSRIAVLISQVLSDMATEEEVRELEAWRGESVENEKTWQELKGRNFWDEKMPVMQRVDMVGGYVKIIRKADHNARRRMWRRVSAMAASLVLPLALAGWFAWHQPGQSAVEGQESGMLLVEDPIVPGEMKAELWLADGSAVRLDGSCLDSLDQAGAKIAVSSGGLSYTDRAAADQLVYNRLKIPRGGEYSLALSDGTVVFLNSETELYYPVQFVGNERRVKLTGEAYFEVAHDVAKPFIVETTHSQVEVLGTSFNLRSYADEKEVAATLVEGRVCFVADEQEKINLLPGEQAVLDGDGRVSKKEVNTYLYTAWKDGDFVFHKQSLEEVMRIVARWYDVEVHFIDHAQREAVFTGNVKRYDDFSKIVKMLEMTGDTQFEINGRNIFIKGK